MEVLSVHINIDELSLYDYVMYTYNKNFDLTDEKRETLEKVLNNCYAKYVKVRQFKDEYALSERGFIGLLGVLVDSSRQDDLKLFGKRCYDEVLSKKQVKSLTMNVKSL